MNVASLELCKELYGLSGWDDTDYYKTRLDNVIRDKRYLADTDTPAYDLGYLLRKLPKVQAATGSAYKYLLTLEYSHPIWNIGYPIEGDFTIFSFGVATTPEGAAASLAIELLKQGMLK